MDLLPADLRRQLPLLYGTEGEEDPLVQTKLFTPWTSWTWYMIEFDGEDLCFGLVDGFELEFGYFSLNELQSIRGPGGLRIERDLYFEPKKVSEINAEIERRRNVDMPRLPFDQKER